MGFDWIFMAKGKDSEEFLVLSQVRTGLKRKFAFALKVQSKMQGTLGRTRARKPEIGDLDNSTGKKLKASPSMTTEFKFVFLVGVGDETVHKWKKLKSKKFELFY